MTPASKPDVREESPVAESKRITEQIDLPVSRRPRALVDFLQEDHVGLVVADDVVTYRPPAGPRPGMHLWML